MKSFTNTTSRCSLCIPLCAINSVGFLAGIAVAILLSGCATARPADYTDAQAFAQNLFLLASKDDAAEWGRQLTAERQRMGETYIIPHFRRWRSTLKDLEEAFGQPVSDVAFRVVDNGLEFQADNQWNLLLRVATEDGFLRINQD